MRKGTIQTRAIAVVTERLASATEVRAVSVVPDFLDGDLVVVSFVDEGAKGELYVYVSEDSTTVYARPEELARASTVRRPNFLIKFGLDQVLRVGGIAGVIALLIAGTICYVLIQRPDAQIPDILGNSLSVILGFYFGSKTARPKARDEALKDA